MSQVVGLKYSDEELKEIDTLAEKESRSRSNFLKMIVKKYLEDQNAPKK